MVAYSYEGLPTSGTTAQRPANAQPGFHYYDSTLNQMIFWNGTSWITSPAHAFTPTIWRITAVRVMNITNTKYRNDHTKIEEDCKCYTCQNYTRAYIAHLFHGKEMLAGTLASTHNLYFIVNLVKKIRQSIIDDNFFEFKKEFLESYLRDKEV